MDNDLEQLMWDYAEGKLNASNETGFLEKINADPKLKKQFENIQSIHLQLKELPVIDPAPEISKAVMDRITNAEIELQIETPEASKERSLIPVILFFFLSLIIIGILLVLFVGKNFEVAPELISMPISDRFMSLLGNIGLLVLSLVILFRLSLSKSRFG